MRQQSQQIMGGGERKVMLQHSCIGIVGRGIDQYCDDHDLGARQRLELFLQVLEAVHFADRAASAALAIEAVSTIEMDGLMKVKLKPGWIYRFGLNSPSFRNFKSRKGVSLEPVQVTFRTKGFDVPGLHAARRSNLQTF